MSVVAPQLYDEDLLTAHLKARSRCFSISGALALYRAQVRMEVGEDP